MLRDSGFCEHGNRPPCSKCLEKEKTQSSREYAPSPAIQALEKDRKIFENPITSESRVLLIGDGQGADTALFAKMGVDVHGISSINYELEEVRAANERLKNFGVTMKQADATELSSLERAGILPSSQDVVTLMHVLEVPDIRGEAERRLMENIIHVLKEGGEAIVTQYKKKLTPEEADFFGVEEIKPDDLQHRFGESWRDEFERQYGQPWKEGMRYSAISNIRTKQELIDLFSEKFEVKLEESDDEYILRMKKKPQQ